MMNEQTPASAPDNDSFFTEDLSVADPEVQAAIKKEERRQRYQIELIASKNYLSHAGRQALESIFAFTSGQGYPGHRDRGGMINLDQIERLAVTRAQQLFRCRYANVQPHSGTQANLAVFFALLKPGDTFLSMSMRAGGHLSHGLRHNISGKWFRAVNYGVRSSDGLIDYDEFEQLAREHKPKLIITGGSAYARAIDFAHFRRLADEVGAYLLADIAHFSGLVAAGLYPSPFPHAHVVTTTTNKNLRGPHGALILSDDKRLTRLLDAAVFPGTQGGPLPELIAAKAVCLGEALKPDFKTYAEAVLDNARSLCDALRERGYDIVTGGTDSPIVMVDLTSKRLTGELAADSLEAAGLPCNKIMVPADSQKASVTSGLRFGTSAITTRGLKTKETRSVGLLIADVLDGLIRTQGDNRIAETSTRAKVEDLAQKFPIYSFERIILSEPLPH